MRLLALNSKINPSITSLSIMSAENLQHFEGSLDEFKSMIAGSKGLVVVKFGTTTCPPCKRLNQILPSIAKDNAPTPFYIVDVDTHPEYSQEYNISSVPDTRFYKDGQEVKSIVGLQVPQIKQAIAENK